jgi:MFS family permease
VQADLDGTGWRPIFLVNVPIGILGLWAARRQLPETRSPQPARPDLLGTALLAAAVVAVLLPLTEGRALGWPAWSVVLLASTPVWVAAFVLTERRLEHRGRTPLLPPSILEHRSMRRGLLLAAPFFAGFGAFMFVYALVVQDRLHWTAGRAGLALLPMAVSFLVASLLMPRLVGRHGRTLVTAGAVLQFLGLAGLAAALISGWPAVGPWELVPAFLVLGFGQGWVIPSLIRVVLSDVPVTSAGVGSGVLTTTQQVALAVGVATLGTLFVSLAGHDGSSTLPAALVVLGVQALIAAGIVLGSRGLPSGNR